jgi:hypothetical protein
MNCWLQGKIAYRETFTIRSLSPPFLSQIAGG